jgi:hypothetical protein
MPFERNTRQTYGYEAAGCELAEALSSLRDQLLEKVFKVSAQETDKRWMVIDDHRIDLIAKAIPRPPDEAALLTLVRPTSRRKRFERFVGQFLDVIAAHAGLAVTYNQATIKLEDKGVLVTHLDSDSTT